MNRQMLGGKQNRILVKLFIYFLIFMSFSNGGRFLERLKDPSDASIKYLIIIIAAAVVGTIFLKKSIISPVRSNPADDWFRKKDKIFNKPPSQNDQRIENQPIYFPGSKTPVSIEDQLRRKEEVFDFSNPVRIVKIIIWITMGVSILSALAQNGAFADIIKFLQK